MEYIRTVKNCIIESVMYALAVITSVAYMCIRCGHVQEEEQVQPSIPHPPPPPPPPLPTARVPSRPPTPPIPTKVEDITLHEDNIVYPSHLDDDAFVMLDIDTEFEDGI